jgi:hypothetical protein
MQRFMFAMVASLTLFTIASASNASCLMSE